MEDIAQRAGVHRTTVSLALRNDPRLPQATRERVQQVARQMGYTPNPLVSALMHYRAGRRPPDARGEIAFLTNAATEHGWKKSPAYERIFAGAQTRAGELGFTLVPLWLGRPGMSGAALSQTFHQRNIHAALVCPQPAKPIGMDWIDWSRVSALAIGYSLVSPLLHRVAHDYFHAIATATRHAMARGHRRIALFLSASSDDKADHLWLGSWLAARGQHAELLPPLILKAEPATAMKAYLREHRPDAICALQSTRFEALLPGARQRPQRIDLGCYTPDSPHPGIYQNYERLGAVAVEQVTQALFRSERGVPQQSHDTLVRGIWVEGAQRR